LSRTAKPLSSQVYFIGLDMAFRQGSVDEIIYVSFLPSSLFMISIVSIIEVKTGVCLFRYYDPLFSICLEGSATGARPSNPARYPAIEARS